MIYENNINIEQRERVRHIHTVQWAATSRDGHEGHDNVEKMCGIAASDWKEIPEYRCK